MHTEYREITKLNLAWSLFLYIILKTVFGEAFTASTNVFTTLTYSPDAIFTFEPVTIMLLVLCFILLRPSRHCPFRKRWS